ncbi:MAG: Fe-S protein assembly co-chaperone HscB [Planctomycetes bacterium]|jgi:Fe-S protein assembly co-chaperone HscB|nr:Fe-S protein assembly co-chaperone HscB [Planctomycetota bacterium]MBV21082.1 Fe-S protein assembly co-chaperone HscB [Planctomycetaceae bacterium]HJM57371.1 Fe-S protein assembly co-chaperone HscB [Planctomycetota bacterium]
MSACPDCGAALQTPLVCEGCGALQTTQDNPSPFEVLGLVRGWTVDRAELGRNLLRLTRLTHPDFHEAHGEEARDLAERNTALVNSAYSTLNDDVLRAEWLLADMGAPSPDEERQMPQQFLMEVLEWNEVLEEVRVGGTEQDDHRRLEGLRTDLQAQRAMSLSQLGQRLQAAEPGDPQTLRQELNTVRYLDRTLNELDELALEKSSTRGD